MFFSLIAVILLVWVARLQARVRTLEERETQWESRWASLEARLRELPKRPVQEAARAATTTDTATAVAADRGRPSEVPVPRPAAPPLAVPPVAQPRPTPAAPPPVPRTEPAEAQLPAAAVETTPVGGSLRPALPPRPIARPQIPQMPPPRPPMPPSGPPPPPPPPAQPFDWEALVGVKLFSWVAGIALALGAIFFLRYSVQSGWLQPPVRMAIGLLTGVGLLVACEFRAARRYAVTANALDAAGIVILFSTFFAAHALWGLIGATATFGLLVLVTAVAVLLSIRRDSVFVALLGLVGGFATPALLASGQDNPIGLFGYLLVLNAGLAWIAYRRRWVILLALSALFTTLYQWGWVLTYLASGSLPTAIGIFLVFPITGAIFLAMLSPRDAETGDAEELTVEDLMKGGPGSRRMFEGLLAIQAVLPLLFAAYLASVPAFADHFGLLFGFLLCVDAGLFAVALWKRPGVLHAIGAASTLVVFLSWWGSRSAGVGWPWVLGFLAVFVLFYLGTGLAIRRSARSLDAAAERAVYAAPLLISVFCLLAWDEPSFANPGLPFGVLFALLAALAAYAIREEDGIVHFAGSFFALVTAAIWSSQYLTPERLLAGLGIDAGFSLFYLGVPLAARRWHRELRPGGLTAALLLLSIGLLFFLSTEAVAASALWSLALLLGILNLAILAEGTAREHPVLATLGTILSWLVLLDWWMSGALGTQPVAAMIVTTGFAVLTIAGHAWLGQRQTANAAAAPSGMALGLVGHLFLAFVALQPNLSVPPWPLFGVLAVLDLAIAVAALYVKRADLHFSSLAATQVILALWAITVTASPWPTVACWAALGFAAFGVVWVILAGRVVSADGRGRFETAAATGLVLAQVVVLIAQVTQAPSITSLLVFHLALLGGLVGLSVWTGRYRFLLVSTVPTALATLALSAELDAPSGKAADALVLATPIYLVYLASAVAFARRVGKRRSLHLAAVLASASYFLVAHDALTELGYAGIIGALPIAQALLMSGVLVRLLQVEPRAERTLGRLAFVAGTVLALVTVAIPLQLDKEWLTIGWALEAAALAWLYTRIPHRGVFWTTMGLSAVVFVRLALNPEVLRYAPHSSTPILNWFLYTYLVTAVAFLVAAWLLRGTDDALAPGTMRGSSILSGAATVLLFLLVNIEIADFYTTEGPLVFNFSAGLAQDLTYTLAWGAFALALLGAGIILRLRAPRLAAIVLLTVTVFKGFLHDTARLGGLYRVFSFVGLAVCLALVAVVLQRFVLGARTEGPGSR